MEVQQAMGEEEIVPPVTQVAIMSLPSYSVEDMGALQWADTVLGEVLGFWERRTFPSGNKHWLLNKTALVLLCQRDRLEEKDWVVCHRVLHSDGGEEILHVLLS